MEPLPRFQLRGWSSLGLTLGPWELDLFPLEVLKEPGCKVLDLPAPWLVPKQLEGGRGTGAGERFRELQRAWAAMFGPGLGRLCSGLLVEWTTGKGTWPDDHHVFVGIELAGRGPLPGTDGRNELEGVRGRVLVRAGDRWLMEWNIPWPQLRRWREQVVGEVQARGQLRGVHVSSLAGSGMVPLEDGRGGGMRLSAARSWYWRAWVQGGDDWTVGHVPLEDLGVAVLQAVARRGKSLRALAAGQGALRLVHGEGDGLKGLDVEWFAGHVALWLEQDVADDKRVGRLVEILRGLSPRSVYVKVRAKNPAGRGPRGMAELFENEPRVGSSAPEPLWVEEDGLQYAVFLADGVQTGLFLDQRANRAWVRRMAEGRDVLNLFSYTCSFGVAAAAGGARSTVNVDVARKALQRGRANYEKNGLDDGDVAMFPDDVTKWVARAARRGKSYGLIVLDPPSFGTAGSRRFSLRRDYPELLDAVVELVPDQGGALLVTTNHRGIASAQLENWIRRAAERARRVMISCEGSKPEPDFLPMPGREPHMKSFRVKLGPRTRPRSAKLGSGRPHKFSKRRS